MRFEDKIRCLGLLCNFSVTSWIRSPNHNAALGGVPTSRHLMGLAVDVVFDNPADAPGFQEAALTLGLQVLFEGDHLHVQEPRSKS